MMLPVPEPTSPAREIADLLRQLVGLQHEQIGLLKAQVAGQDNGSKWRAFLARWEDEFPQIGCGVQAGAPDSGAGLSRARPRVDRRVNAAEAAELDDEFVLGEFLDRFGIRLGQLGNILSQLAPLADAAPTPVENG